jgi:hypothetical protein
MKFEVKTTTEVDVKFLKADCGVRYWEDATVNGVQDGDGELIPCRQGDGWAPLIDLETGKVEDWPEGTKADIHYKVCDAGIYSLLDADRNVVASFDGYVPSMMSPGGSGYGDYVIMTIGEDGVIEGWEADLDDFGDDRD